MKLRFKANILSIWGLFAILGQLTLTAVPSYGDDLAFGGRHFRPRSGPIYPAPEAAPMEQAPAQQAPAQPPQAAAPQAVEPSITPEQSAATGAGESFAAVSSAVGYIDPALPISQIRLRADAAYGNNRPDRAEFFYAKCGCFRAAGLDPHADGPGGGPPIAAETSIDYQDITSTVEYAPVQRFSMFVDVPVRFLNPTVLQNTAGLADMNAGLKYAFQYENDRISTFQLRTYIPTGASTHGLGTNHVSIEPGLLIYRQLSDRLYYEGELRDWIPVGGTDFSGNVIRYGSGLSYLAYNAPSIRFFPVFELVGWTVFNGQELATSGTTAVTQSADGDTIINAKFGLRTALGAQQENLAMSRADVYVGYGRALTGEVWYKDVMRLELRVRY